MLPHSHSRYSLVALASAQCGQGETPENRVRLLLGLDRCDVFHLRRYGAHEHGETHPPVRTCTVRPGSYETRSPVPDARREEQFRTFFHDNYHRILGYAIRRTLTPEDAADIVSETFLTA
jgi:hypothetical protein